MSRTKFVLVLAFLAILSLRSALPQQPVAAPTNPPALTGSVIGYVAYAESQLPARFAEMHLAPIPADAHLVPVKESPTIPGVEGDSEKKLRLQVVFGSSGMDGSFRMDGVPAGDYLVAALKPGYLTPGAAAAMDADISDDQLKTLIASMPQVHVAVGQTASVNLTLHRGAVIAGRMQFADGSPAIGASVGCESIDHENILLRPELRGKVPSLLQQALQSLVSSKGIRPGVFTDDAGRYRVFGLSPGKYIVTTGILLDHSPARIVMDDGSSPPSSRREHMYPEIIAVYGPGTFRRKDARIFEIRGDEQITDADLTIDPAGLHTLRGKVLAAEDRHAPSFTMVRLREDGAKDIGRFVEIEDDGSFLVNYLPSGNYTLKIDASDNPANPSDTPTQPRTYNTVKLAVVVIDHDVVLDDVLLTALKPGEKNPNFEF